MADLITSILEPGVISGVNLGEVHGVERRFDELAHLARDRHRLRHGGIWRYKRVRRVGMNDVGNICTRIRSAQQSSLRERKGTNIGSKVGSTIEDRVGVLNRESERAL